MTITIVHASLEGDVTNPSSYVAVALSTGTNVYIQ